MIRYERYEYSEQDYLDGYQDGQADRLLGIDPLIVVVTSIWPSYAAGYHEGYNTAKPNRLASLTKGAES